MPGCFLLTRILEKLTAYKLRSGHIRRFGKQLCLHYTKMPIGLLLEQINWIQELFMRSKLSAYIIVPNCICTNSPIQNSPIQNSTEKYENERKNSPIQKQSQVITVLTSR